MRCARWSAAAERGVKVRIITPGSNIDSEVVRKASRARWGDLLAAGVEIAEYQPTMYHCKVLIVDALLVSVGSTNFDNRSFRLNDEANLNVLDAAFARQQIEIFERRLEAREGDDAAGVAQSAVAGEADGACGVAARRPAVEPQRPVSARGSSSCCKRSRPRSVISAATSRIGRPSR